MLGRRFQPCWKSWRWVRKEWSPSLVTLWVGRYISHPVFFQVSVRVICHELKRHAEVGRVSLEWCVTIDIVCHNRKESCPSSLNMYNLFSNAYARLSFDELTMSVLCILNVTHTQLHSNSWTSLQAFRLVQMFDLCPSPQSSFIITMLDLSSRLVGCWVFFVA